MEKAGKEWERVQEIDQSQTGNGGAEEQNEEKELNYPPNQIFFQAGVNLFVPEERIEKIDGRARGTDDLPPGQDSAQPQKGIQVKIDIRWNPFRELVVGKDEEKEGEDNRETA